MLDLLNRVVEEYSNAYEHHDVFRSERVTLEAIKNTGFNWVPHHYNFDPVTYFARSGELGDSIQLLPFEVESVFEECLKDEERFDPTYLVVFERENEAIGEMAYRADRVTSSTIERFWDSLERFVATLADSPKARIIDMSCF